MPVDHDAATAPLQRNLLPRTSSVDEKGHLHVGGIDVLELAEEFGTPVFVYDEAHLRHACREAVEAWGDGVAYATKAFLCRAVARLAHEEGMHLDVASGGELHVALSADLLLPCKTIRSGGTPADRATWSSPPEATSRCMPSSWASRATARQRNALVA